MSNVTENTWNGLKKRLFYSYPFYSYLINIPTRKVQIKFRKNLIVESAAGVLLGILGSLYSSLLGIPLCWDYWQCKQCETRSKILFYPGLTNLKALKSPKMLTCFCCLFVCFIQTGAVRRPYWAPHPRHSPDSLTAQSPPAENLTDLASAGPTATPSC